MRWARPSTRRRSFWALPYPGGPQVEALARQGNAQRFDFPRPLKGREDCNFSFSGLKTAVREAVQQLASASASTTSPISAPASRRRSPRRCATGWPWRSQLFAKRIPDRADRRLVVAGGVAANPGSRRCSKRAAPRRGFRLIVPPAALCTDNAAMVAWAGAERLALGLVDPLDAPARAALAARSFSARHGAGARGQGMSGDRHRRCRRLGQALAFVARAAGPSGCGLVDGSRTRELDQPGAEADAIILGGAGAGLPRVLRSWQLAPCLANNGLRRSSSAPRASSSGPGGS